MDRRLFVQTLIASSVASHAGARALAANSSAEFGKLRPDPNRIIDLPTGFSYTIVARTGDAMDDGLLMPGQPDGMAAFSGKDGRINLVMNHENHPLQRSISPFGKNLERLGRVDKNAIYDVGSGKTPGTGGTTTVVYNPVSRQVERKHLSLAGTEYNCAGGPTPWGSWLSCEECFTSPGKTTEYLLSVHREQRHGYIFEVPALATEIVAPVPLKDMGRFEHEAAAVEPRSGMVYLTEDKDRSLIYRFRPNLPGQLARGGKLQALVVKDQPALDTRNWSSPYDIRAKEWHEVRWLDLEDVDSDDNDLRLRGHAAGAARFACGEGICTADGNLFFTCTSGGQQRLGQIFQYEPSPFEGTSSEDEQPGKMRLLVELNRDSVLQNADNLTMSPWGDLVVCEDTTDHAGLICVRPNGEQYLLADNAYSDSELAGVCFAPDGKTLFVNIQYAGLTLAITGPWPGSTN